MIGTAERALVVAPARAAALPALGLAFAASAGTLVLELVAGRMLSPYVGVSLHTWTAIIGVVLAGLSLGNWLGGPLADRASSSRSLGALFVLGGVASAASLLIVPALGALEPARSWPLLVRVFMLAAAFLPPSLILGMVTPIVIKRILPDLGATGRAAGMVYAAGTVGSLVGNFATGFVLTAYFTTTAIVLGVAVALVAVGLVSGRTGARGASSVGDADAAGTGASTTGADGRATYAVSADAGGAGATALGAAAKHGAGADGSATNGRAAAVGGERLGASWDALGRGDALSLHGNLVLACLVVCLSSFAMMGVELGASRLLAPYLGLSLYSWTGIIGVVLAGIALGNFLGGRIADRWPSQRVLGTSLLAGALGALAILWLEDLLQSSVWVQLGLVERIVAETAVIFFVPVLLLGTISPQVIRLTVSDLRHAGRTAGITYAVSTAGAIVGTFASGWWLIPTYGVHWLMYGMGVVLLLLALLVARVWERPALLFAFVALGGGLAGYLWSKDAVRSRCTVETAYYCIRVADEVHGGDPVRSLVLDHLVHSYVKVDDPTYLGYVHEEIQAEITQYAAALHPDARVLVIGGGGYTYPRWVEAKLPNVGVEVVEIDPGVTEVAHEHLALPRSTRIVSHNMDGRQFIQELAPRGAYSLVVQDAVNDLSVPYHILTREYDQQVKALLRPDGAYLLTVIDLFDGGQLLRSSMRTLLQVFPRVQLFAAGAAWQSGGANVWVIAGSERGVDVNDMRARLGVPLRTTEMPDPMLRRYVADGPQIVLTDQYAPVDNLIAILFRSRGA